MQLPAVPDPAALDVIRAQLDAFNRHDVQAMVGNISTDFAWYFVEGDTMVLELQGRAAFETSMIRYFAAIPEARAEIDQMFEIGAYIAVRERAFWQLDGREVSAASLAVYEIRDSRIRRVWYYPAES